MGRCTPGATKHDYQSKAHRDNDHTREEQTFDTVLDGVKNHEGEDEPDEEQEQRA